MKKLLFLVLAIAYGTCCTALSRIEMVRSGASRSLAPVSTGHVAHRG